MNYLILTLANNIDVVGKKLYEIEHKICLSDPMTFKQEILIDGHNPSILLQRYIPYSKEKQFIFDTSHILGKTTPNQYVIDLYKVYVKYFYSYGDKSVEKQFVDSLNFALRVIDKDESISFQQPINKLMI